MSHSTAEAGELSPRDPVEGRGHRQVAPVEGKTANTPRLGPVSTSRHRIAELARQALGMAVAIAWLPGPAGTRRRVAKPSIEEPDAAEPARPDLWGARVSNDPGLPDRNPAASHVPIRIISPRVLRAVSSSRAVCCVCLLDQSVAAVGVQEYLSYSLGKYVKSTRVRRIRVRPSPA